MGKSREFGYPGGGRSREDFFNASFRGPNAMSLYLTADQHLPPSYLHLDERFNPYYDVRKVDGVKIPEITIAIKNLAEARPFGLGKQYGAEQMLVDAKEQGLLKGIHTLVGASSGNMILALNGFKDRFGLQRTIAVIRPGTPPSKSERLRAHGIQVITSKNSMQLAAELGKLEGFFDTDQYTSLANARGYKRVGKEIKRQAKKDGGPSLISVALGSTGTIGGMDLAYGDSAYILGNQVEGTVSGARDEEQLKQIGLDYKKAADRIRTISDVDAHTYAANLVQAGILVGPTTGLGYAGILKELEHRIEVEAKIATTKRKRKDIDPADKADRLKKLRNRDGKIVAVFLAHDSDGPYSDDYIQKANKQFNPIIKADNYSLEELQQLLAA